MAAKEVHVLIVTLATQGHMNPMLRLSKRLASKGLHVIIATTDVARNRILNSTTSITTQNTTTKNPRIELEFFSDGLSHDFDRDKYIGSLVESLRTKGSKNLSNLIAKLINNGMKLSCIITNPFLPWVPNVASTHDIPCAVLWIQACAVFSIYYDYVKHPSLFPSLENPNQSVKLPGLPLLKVKDLPSFILPSTIIGLQNLVSDFIRAFDKVKWVLGNSFYELEEDIVKSMALVKPIYPIGPLVSPLMLGKKEIITGSIDMWSAEDSCIEWLDKKPPSSVIYISFGSIIVFSQKQMDSIASALKNSKLSFLWVIKPPDKGSHKKCGKLSPEFLEETKEKGLVVTWCSQEKVLMHQAVACFMTHCGWNSTIETIVAGVPVIAYPEWTDQSTVAKLLVDVFKMGVRMRSEEDGALSTEEVERCFKEVTDGLQAVNMKKRAIELREAAKKALANGGSSDNNLDQFINEIMQKSY